jgi:hypothetical protein
LFDVSYTYPNVIELFEHFILPGKIGLLIILQLLYHVKHP